MSGGQHRSDAGNELAAPDHQAAPTVGAPPMLAGSMQASQRVQLIENHALRIRAQLH